MMRTPTAMRGVNVVLRRDGSEIHIDDITTSEHGQDILDEIDAAILQIEGQLEFAGAASDFNWRTRAKIALKHKRRLRPTLQKRIADLRRAEKQAAIPKERITTIRPEGEAKRVAFINAAEELLEADLFTEIWTRAAERNPEVFGKMEARHA